MTQGVLGRVEQPVVWRASIAVTLVAIGTGVSPVFEREPAELFGPWVLGVGLLLLAVPVFLLRILLKRTARSVLPALPVLFAAVVVFGSVASAESLHWRWSRADFQAVVDGERAVHNCSLNDPCDVGWWSVEDADLAQRLPTVWIRQGDCYAGHGFARLAPDMTLAEAEEIATERYESRGYVDVRPWRDDWALICITT